MERRVFLVTSGRLAVYTWDSGRLGDPLSFGADEDGLTQFSAYLERYDETPVYMLVDFVEEEFREETIPHVLGGDRKALIRTKLNRLFRDATYSHAIFQEREREGRRDDRMLFTALIRPDMLAPWVGQITKHKVPLAGIYSLPVLSQALLKPLDIAHDRVLLVTLQSSGALRQTFFSGGTLKLSRLAVLPNVDPRGYASYVLGEIEKLRRYLNSLRLLGHDSPLEVYMLASKDLLGDIEQQSPDSVTTRHHGVPLEELVRKLGVKGAYNSPFADRLFAHLLASRPPPNQYAPAIQTRYHVTHKTRRALKVASVVSLVGGLMLGASNGLDGLIASSEAETVRRQADFYDDRYRVARERLPATPAESRDMKHAVDLVGTLASFRGVPTTMMVTLSGGLDRFPALRLERVDWLSSTDPDATPGERRQRSRDAQEAAPDPDAETTLYQLARVKGEITPFDGNYRNALELVGRFAERLRANPQVSEVQIVSLPLDVGSENRLTGDASADARARSAPFVLRVVLREDTDDAR